MNRRPITSALAPYSASLELLASRVQWLGVIRALEGTKSQLCRLPAVRQEGAGVHGDHLPDLGGPDTCIHMSTLWSTHPSDKGTLPLGLQIDSWHRAGHWREARSKASALPSGSSSGGGERHAGPPVQSAQVASTGEGEGEPVCSCDLSRLVHRVRGVSGNK